MKASRHTQFLLTSLFFFVFSSFDFSLQAFHIVGGEVTYECINEPNGTYRINLTIYRDCAGQGAPFDSIGYIFIYENGSNALTNTLEALHNPSQIENVNPPTDICLETLPDVCIEVYTYQEIVTNLTSSAGYTIVYQRYSRNVGILNLVSSGMVGSSYVATIPPTDLAVCNTSAVFNELPPTVICAGAPLYINQSATDEDGDSLVYELCSSLVGGTSFCVQPGSPVYCDPPNDPAPPPPYDIVPYAPGFSGENPVTSEPALSINPVTGLLTGTPTQTGLFVVGICVREFRNGVEIGITNRDFQFTVADCSVISAAVQSDDISAAGEFLITNCDDFTVSFSNTSIGAVSYEWMFDDFPSGTANFSDLINPTHEYPDSGQYNVTLVANSNIDGCVDTAYIILNLYPTLQADFGFGTGCAMTPITFQDLSTSTYGEVVEWEWDMGDSTIITGEAMPEYSYAEGGTYNVTLSTTTSVGCTDQKVLAVTVDPVPIADFTTTLRCPGQPIDFVDASTEANVVSWSWDFGDPDNSNDNSDNPTPSYTYYLPGSYEVFFTVVSDDGCEATYTETIDIYPEFVASVSENTMMCFSDSVQLVATDEFDFFSYAWSSPETMDDPTSQTPMVSPATTTTYTVTVSDPNGCLDVADVTVTVLPLPIVEVGAPSTICFGDTHTFSAASIGSNVVNFEWTSSEGYSNTSEVQPTVMPDTTTTYVLYAIDDMGCENTDTAVIEVIPAIVPSPIEGANEICEGESTQLGISGGINYTWTPTNSLDDPTSPTPIATPSETTEYVVGVGNSCFTVYDTVTILVNPLPELDAGQNTTINIGETTTLEAFANSDFVWSNPETMDDPSLINPTVMPLATTTYLLTGTSDKGCVETDSAIVTVTNIFEVVIPTAFSPNNDGLNDEFRILSTKGIKNLYEFRIYNRWGELIFETTNPEVGWNGEHRTRLAPGGVYVYYINTETFLDEAMVFKGNLTLVR